MIEIRYMAVVDGQVVKDDTTFFDGNNVAEVTRWLRIRGHEVVLTTSFNPPLITELDLLDDPDRKNPK